MGTYADDRIGKTIYADDIKLLKVKHRKRPLYTAQRAELKLINVDYSDLLNKVGVIEADNIITPQEKITLKLQWESLNALRVNTLSKAEQFGIESQQQYLNYIEAYNDLESLMGFILDPLAMDKNTDISEKPSLTALFESYYDLAVLVDEQLFRLETGMISGMNYKIKFEVSVRASINPLKKDGTPSTLTASIIDNGEEITDQFSEDNFRWFRGSEDDEADETWNSTEKTGKTLVVSNEDLVYRYASFGCEFTYYYSETMYVRKVGFIALSEEIPGEDGQDAISIQIFSTNGNIFREGTAYTTMMAYVFRGTEDITDEIDASKFNWERNSGNTTEDESWNTSSKAVGKKIVELTPSDVLGRSVFACHVDI